MCRGKTMECTFLFVKTGMVLPPGNNWQEANEFSVLYAATMKGSKQLLGKS